MTDTLPASPELTLEPCPFCGATMKRADWHASLWIGHAENCYLKGVLTFDEHVAAWNRRSSPSSAWRDIKDAPKDGTAFLAMNKDKAAYSYRVVYFDDEAKPPYVWHVED